MSDETRRSGFCRDIIRRLPARSLVHLRAIDRCLLTLERGGPVDDSDLAVKLDDILRDVVGYIEAEERAEDEAHERAREEMFHRRIASAAAIARAESRTDSPEAAVADEFADEQHDDMDVSDAESPIAVHGPDYDFEGGVQ